MEKSKVIESTLYKGKAKIRFFPDSHIYYVNGERRVGVTTILGIIDKSRPLIIWATDLARDFLLGCISQGMAIQEEHIHEAAGLHEVRKKEAAAIGDEVHHWIELYVQGKPTEMPESREAQIGVNAFLDWEAAHKVKFLSSERVVYSLKNKFIGKMDIEAKVDGQLCLIDIKTSNGIYNTYGLQTAAYVRADEEESTRKYKGRWIIRVSKETEADYIARMAKKNASRLRKGSSTVEFPPYQVFEANYLDENPKNLDRDYKAFLAAQALYEWNKETDTFLNGKK